MNRDYQTGETPRKAEEVELAFRNVIAQVVLHNYDVAEAIGLSPRDMQAIHLLQLRGAMSPGQLGQALGLASGSTTALIDRLERAGYAIRNPDPRDRRKLVVSVIEDRLATDLVPRYAAQAEALRRVTALFAPRELAIIGRFLRALTDTD